MGIEHSSGAGTGRSIRSGATTTTTSPTVDGTGRANNHRLVHFGHMGYLYMYPAFAFASASASTSASASESTTASASRHFLGGYYRSYLCFRFLGSTLEIGIPASSFGTSGYTWYGQLPFDVRLFFSKCILSLFRSTDNFGIKSTRRWTHQTQYALNLTLTSVMATFTA